MHRATEKQFDALDNLCADEIFRDVRPDLRNLPAGIFASFTVHAKTILCAWKHRYLIYPDGTVNQLLTKTIGG